MENEFYFKDSFSQSEGNVNLLVNNLTAACISSSNNKFNLDSDGNLIVNTIQTIGGTQTGYDIDKVYPVGSIYMNVNETDPSTLFGGIWERIKDRFLLSTGDLYSNGILAGRSSVKLDVNNMPRHAHTATTSSGGAHNHVGTVDYSGEHRHNTQGQWRIALNTSSENRGLSYNQIANDPVRTDTSILTAGGHTHTFTTSSVDNHTHTLTTSEVGENVAFDNMPPYLTVYMWKRVS